MYLFEPVGFEFFEWLAFGEIVDYDYALGSFVVGASDGPETFLTSGVPYLEFDNIAAHADWPVITIKHT